MAKDRTVYVCQRCGNESSKWMGKCPACNEWNTFIEQKLTGGNAKTQERSQKNNPQKLSQIEGNATQRIATGINEFDRVLGGGLVPGAVVLLGGEPGIGKSTLVLQMAMLQKEHEVMYVTGEESAQQLKRRAQRLEHTNEEAFILNETNVENILNYLREFNPGIVVVDSIQTLFSDGLDSSAGTVSQIRECTVKLLKYAKENHIPVLLIGHITKDGVIAGPKVLEHIVDTVIQFEGDQNYLYRILRSSKNRFGSTSEIGIFEMTGKGLKEILNPSDILIHQGDEPQSGAVIGSMISGVRPLLIEVQALVGNSVYSSPQRSSTGFDGRRLGMLLAVLEKKIGIRISAKDVYLNIAGGLRVDDPGIDLAVLVAVVSSYLDTILPKSICFTAEVGLTGEIRPSSRVHQRIQEAKKMGMSKIVVSKYTKDLDDRPLGLDVLRFSKVSEMIRHIFRESL